MRSKFGLNTAVTAACMGYSEKKSLFSRADAAENCTPTTISRHISSRYAHYPYAQTTGR
jgi:hypothetical protein